MMRLYQYIVIAFALFAMIRTLVQYRKRVLHNFQFVFWEAAWAFIIVFVLFAPRFSFLSDILGIDILNLAVYASIVLLLFLCYKLIIKQEKMQQEITKLVREIAIERGRK